MGDREGNSGRLGGTQLGRNVQRRLVENVTALAKAPGLADAAGKIWNGPNTAIGLGYGLAGYAAGQLNRLRPGDQPDPRIRIGNNAIEFLNNPAGGVGAVTLGNTTTYSGDP